MENSFNLNEFCNDEFPLSNLGLGFNANVVAFLLQCCQRIEDHEAPGMQLWRVCLKQENRSFTIPLYIVEENVQTSPHPYCHDCAQTGWRGDLVCKTAYHLIIPAEDEWRKLLEASFLTNPYYKPILRGLFHSNGMGHLLCLNGTHGGSKFLYGREAMSLWDRICTKLRCRQISVRDLSTKLSMHLRLLLGVSFKVSWFGKWGYKFGRAGFSITEEAYKESLSYLRKLKLSKVIEALRETDEGSANILDSIIHQYELKGDIKPLTVGDLLRMMLHMRLGLPPKERRMLAMRASVGGYNVAAEGDGYDVAAEGDKWNRKELDIAVRIVNILKTQDRVWMTRTEFLSNVHHTGGIYATVLKKMDNTLIEDVIVHRRRQGKAYQYKIEDPPAAQAPGENPYTDLLFLYEHVLRGNGHEFFQSVLEHSRNLLDVKYFIKVFPLLTEECSHDALRSGDTFLVTHGRRAVNCHCGTVSDDGEEMLPCLGRLSDDGQYHEQCRFNNLVHTRCCLDNPEVGYACAACSLSMSLFDIDRV